MKKIINGKRYDTKTARFVGEASYGYGRDFAKWEERLFLKKTGEFFLAGVGGPASKYKTSTYSNSWSGGEKIIPLTLNEAKKWVEEHMDAEDYEEIFGRIDEDKFQISTWIHQSIKEKADLLRDKQNKTLAEIFEAGINVLLKE